MTSPDHRPRFSAEQAAQLAATHFGVAGVAAPLPSDRDQNFRIDADDGRLFVLKIANSAEDPSVLALQHAMFDRLRDHVPCPAVCRTHDGDAMTTVVGDGGQTHLVRLITYLPGQPLATASPHSAELLRTVGRTLGTLTSALDGFDHPAAHHDLHWDLQHTLREIDRHRHALTTDNQRQLVDQFRERFATYVAPRLPDLRRSVIHGDANDYNLLVGPPHEQPRRVSGVIDFGDAVYSCTVFEPAIAAAYAILGKREPVTAAAYLIGDYHAAFPLTATEIDLLADLIAARLCVSVCVSSHRQTIEPDNAYLTISQQPAWDALARWARVPPRLITARLRRACGLPPVAASDAIARWLSQHADSFAPVCEFDLRTTPVTVFDFSVSSPDLGDLWQPRSTEAWAAWIFGRMEAANTPVGIGRYDEPRLAYQTDAFATDADEYPERRTIHLGIDLFLPPGAPIFAPLDGVVHSVRDNDGYLDYGPTIILEHSADGVPFYTLYGHLSRASLAGRMPGHRVQAGQQIASIGRIEENGHWSPHLHFQIITDMLDQTGGFNGVAAPSQRAVWQALSPDPNLILGIPDEAFPPRPPSPEAILAQREQMIGHNLSISYRPKPLTIVRAARQYLYDHNGQAYLDCVNNVAHVGHGHPLVVAAATRQQGVLNTNTRYLHPNLVAYAERLTATLPAPLSVCFFVNSGSEANDLALRLARAHTGHSDVIIVDGAYHGHTSALIDLSPYKFDGPGGRGQPDHVQRTLMPDGYRGPFKGQARATGVRYAADVADRVQAIEAQGHGAAAFFCESVLGCGGQIVLPDGYLQAAFAHVRAAGGVCVADEVQVGFGRIGTHFWGFEAQDVVPDIVTMGKPIGNGHPLAAVVTTPAIAASFANGMEYFNTFGGNPVSCAVGIAVLDAIERDGLQHNARTVGDRLLAGLRALVDVHPLIGDVRGMGLFVGVELVRDRDTLAPAAAEAAAIALRMREHGVLISTDGPLHNVLKLKPPLCFSAENADRVVATLDKILREDAFKPA